MTVSTAMWDQRWTKRGVKQDEDEHALTTDSLMPRSAASGEIKEGMDHHESSRTHRTESYRSKTVNTATSPLTPLTHTQQAEAPSQVPLVKPA
jgi:hypothetical protein